MHPTFIAAYAECVYRYVPEHPPVADPYAASALRSSSRPVSPLLPPGGMRGPAIQTAESSARWAAAALRGSVFPQARAVPGGLFGVPRGAGMQWCPKCSTAHHNHHTT